MHRGEAAFEPRTTGFSAGMPPAQPGHPRSTPEAAEPSPGRGAEDVPTTNKRRHNERRAQGPQGGHQPRALGHVGHQSTLLRPGLTMRHLSDVQGPAGTPVICNNVLQTTWASYERKHQTSGLPLPPLRPDANGTRRIPNVVYNYAKRPPRVRPRTSKKKTRERTGTTCVYRSGAGFARGDISQGPMRDTCKQGPVRDTCL